MRRLNVNRSFKRGLSGAGLVAAVLLSPLNVAVADTALPTTRSDSQLAAAPVKAGTPASASKSDGAVVREAFLAAFDRARNYDPAYQTALADFQTARLQAQSTLFSFAPTLRYAETTLENEARSRKSLTLVQPLFSMERIAVFREGDTRAAVALANLQIKEYDLLRRLWAAVSDYIRANEGLRTNTARLSTLEAEASKAKKAFDLGQGTITDVRDTQVRLDQARATDFSLKAKRQTARRAIAAITGEVPADGAFRLSQRTRDVKLRSLDDYTGMALRTNHELMNANGALRLAELEGFKAKGAFVPEVSYLIRKSQLGGNTTDSASLQVSIPLQSQDVFRVLSSSSALESAKSQVRTVETRVLQDVERFWTMLDASMQESNTRLQAIDSAALSVTANEKSFQGGVRTRLDVLNSVQTQFQVAEDYVTSVTGLADQYLGLGIVSAQSIDEIVRGLQRLLFE